MTTTRRTFAAFDFDGTLTRRDTLVPFLTSVAGRTAVMRAFAAESSGLARAAAGRGDRDVAKERVLTRVLAGVPHSEVSTAGCAFGVELARRAITPEARDRIAWHRREGHDVVIVSASLDVYLGGVAEALGVTHLLCTSLDIDDRGACTGRLLGANCRGPEKATRLQTLFGREGFGSEEIELWAYGNSRGDDEMLALADHAVRARRGRFTRSA
jgi:phosphatidylglycerophosphatase C